MYDPKVRYYGGCALRGRCQHGGGETCRVWEHKLTKGYKPPGAEMETPAGWTPLGDALKTKKAFRAFVAECAKEAA